MGQLVLKQAPAPTASPAPAATAPFPAAAPDGTAAVAELCGRVVEGTRRLSEYVVRNRRLSRERGLDVVAMQLQGIVDRERLDEVQKMFSMGSNVRRTMPVDPGLATRLGNAEKMLEDAGKEAMRPDFSGGPAAEGSEMGQQQGGGIYWVPFAVIGAVVVGAVILMSQSKKKSEPAKELPSFERKR